MTITLLLIVLFFQFMRILLSERNVKEEDICNPFLTSPKTSPLVANLKRNKRIDEDGEFSCELVLQDPDLPIQIRSIIHEGLSWLAIRHVQAGERRHSTVLRHLTSLTQIAPSHFDFSFRAGNWALEPQLMKVPEAIKFYYNCLYGKASNYSNNENNNDKVIPSDKDIYFARREYARALILNGQYEEAKIELVKLLSNKVIDFGAAFRLRTININNHRYENNNSINIELENILTKYDKIYSDIISVSSNNYTGFIPSKDWKPEIFSILPSSTKFDDYVKRREPMIISLGSWLDFTLGWKTKKWNNNNDDNYLTNMMSNEMVLVELINNTNSRKIKSNKNFHNNNNNNNNNSILFGFGSDAQRKIISFKSFMESFNGNNVELKDYLVYLNIQGSDLKHDDIYKPPLHRLKDDIPTPSFLKNAIDNLTAVNLWMGNSYEGPTTSRLHMDAMDNLYVVLKGYKTFTVYPPNLANNMRTISPTISVASNGHSFQYKVPSIDNDNDNNDNNNNNNNNNKKKKKNALKNDFLFPKDHKYIDYDKDKYHFSSLSNLDDPLLGEALGKEIKFSLKPGDILYLPAGWFHQVTSSMGQHQAINYWWKPPNWENALTFEQNSLKTIYQKLKSISINSTTQPEKQIFKSEL